MSSLIGSLNVMDLSNGYYCYVTDGKPADWVAEMRGQRVLIPGSPGYFTPEDNFEADILVIRYHAFVIGSGSSHDDRVDSFTSRMNALKTACDVTGRADVTLTEGSYTAQAGFARFEGPGSEAYVGEAREFDIVFEATDPPEWEATGS